MYRGLAIVCTVIGLLFLADWLAYSPVQRVSPQSWNNPESLPVPAEFTKRNQLNRDGSDGNYANYVVPTNWHRTNIPANHLTFSSGWPGKPGAPMIPEVPICEIRLEASTNWPWGGDWYSLLDWPTNASQVILERSNFPNWTLFRTVER